MGGYGTRAAASFETRTFALRASACPQDEAERELRVSLRRQARISLVEDDR